MNRLSKGEKNWFKEIHYNFPLGWQPKCRKDHRRFAPITAAHWKAY